MSVAKKSVSVLASAAVLCVMFSLMVGCIQPIPTAYAVGGEQWKSSGPTAPSTVYTVTYTLSSPSGGVGVHNNAK